MTLAEHTAEAYLKMAEINHYLIRVHHPEITQDVLEDAKQILIAHQHPGDPNFHTYEFALDLIEYDIDQMRRV